MGETSCSSPTWVLQSMGPRPNGSNNCYFDVGHRASHAHYTAPVIGAGVTTGNDFAALLAELNAWKAFILGLSAEFDYEQSALPRVTRRLGGIGLIENYPGVEHFIISGYQCRGSDFDVNNTDWIINGTGNKVILRLHEGSNFKGQ